MTKPRTERPAVGGRAAAGITRRNFIEVTGAAAALGAGAVLAAPPSPVRAAAVRSVALEVVEVGGRCVYNGIAPGLTISADPGDTIEVHLVNWLPTTSVDDDCPADHNNIHGLNTTNLHTHGLHVLPDTDCRKPHSPDAPLPHPREPVLRHPYQR